MRNPLKSGGFNPLMKLTTTMLTYHFKAFSRKNSKLISLKSKKWDLFPTP